MSLQKPILIQPKTSPPKFGKTCQILIQPIKRDPRSERLIPVKGAKLDAKLAAKPAAQLAAQLAAHSSVSWAVSFGHVRLE